MWFFSRRTENRTSRPRNGRCCMYNWGASTSQWRSTARRGPSLLRQDSLLGLGPQWRSTARRGPRLLRHDSLLGLGLILEGWRGQRLRMEGLSWFWLTKMGWLLKADASVLSRIRNAPAGDLMPDTWRNIRLQLVPRNDHAGGTVV